MEILPVITTSVLLVLGIVFGAIGIQLLLVLNEVRKTLTKVNSTIDEFEKKVNMVFQPMMKLGAMAGGFKAGMKAVEKFTAWLNRQAEGADVVDGEEVVKRASKMKK